MSIPVLIPKIECAASTSAHGGIADPWRTGRYRSHTPRKAIVGRNNNSLRRATERRPAARLVGNVHRSIGRDLHMAMQPAARVCGIDRPRRSECQPPVTTRRAESGGDILRAVVNCVRIATNRAGGVLAQMDLHL